MKKTLPALLGIAVCAGLFCATTATAAESTTASQAPGTQFAQSISTLTGVAISPLLGTSAYGAVKYYRTPVEKRAALPWFAQPWFWVPALLLVAICFVKDTAGASLPTAVKKPFDAGRSRRAQDQRAGGDGRVRSVHRADDAGVRRILQHA